MSIPLAEHLSCIASAVPAFSAAASSSASWRLIAAWVISIDAVLERHRKLSSQLCELTRPFDQKRVGLRTVSLPCFHGLTPACRGIRRQGGGILREGGYLLVTLNNSLFDSFEQSASLRTYTSATCQREDTQKRENWENSMTRGIALCGQERRREVIHARVQEIIWVRVGRERKNKRQNLRR